MPRKSSPTKRLSNAEKGFRSKRRGIIDKIREQNEKARKANSQIKKDHLDSLKGVKPSTTVGFKGQGSCPTKGLGFELSGKLGAEAGVFIVGWESGVTIKGVWSLEKGFEGWQTDVYSESSFGTTGATVYVSAAGKGTYNFDLAELFGSLLAG